MGQRLYTSKITQDPKTVSTRPYFCRVLYTSKITQDPKTSIDSTFSSSELYTSKITQDPKTHSQYNFEYLCCIPLKLHRILKQV